MQTSTVSASRRPVLRLFLIAVLLAVVVIQVIVMVGLMQTQVRSAEERAALDTSSRARVALCFETSTSRAMETCVLDGTPRKVTEIIDNRPASPTIAKGAEPSSVVPVGFAAAR